MPEDRTCPQLDPIMREHQEALAFAEHIAELAHEGSEQRLAEGVRLVREYYDRNLESHLQLEEQTMFGPLLAHDRGHFPLCMRIGKEHGFLRTVATGICMETAARDLSEFAAVLRQHTLFEEQELLPLIATLFTAEQLDAVLNFSPLPTTPVSRTPG